ncbi:hypothetical protein EI533_33740, partial [Pseudomonas donghuensis]|nr:hypothetical protein [Pseudomonas donghuensis]
CAAGATATAYATTSANRNNFTLPDPTRSLTVACGALTLDANNLRVFTANPSSSEAIRVIVSHSIPQSFAGGIGAVFGGAPAGATL